MTRVLLVVSADREEDRSLQVLGKAPRRDYLELARVLNADIYDFSLVSAGRIAPRRRKLATGGLLQAWGSSRRFSEYDVVFTDNERVGVFVAILLRLKRNRPAHVMLGHHLTPAKKRPFLLLARSGIDHLLVHSPAQRHLALTRLGVAAENVQVLPYQVDTDFWRPLGSPIEELVCSAGLECRDYPTLLSALEALPLRATIGAASNWSSKRSNMDERGMPPNIELQQFTYSELRQVYDRSFAVIVPLLDVDFQAGITSILEAMAMRKPLIVSSTHGLPDSVRGPSWEAGQMHWPTFGLQPAEASGIFVPPGDAAALRSAVRYLQANQHVADLLGRNGRARAETEFSVDNFARRMADAILDTAHAKALGRLSHAASA
jgi:glycosyltransferase involved in cell wall biosynthesis